MSDFNSRKDFIYKSRKIHTNNYDYSKVVYINSKINVVIGCSKHGFFEITPSNHLQGNICPSCAKEKSLKKRYNKFIKDSIKHHSDTYDYSLVEYKDNYEEVKIICKIHGEFRQIPKVHRNGSGCSKCALKKVQKLRRENPTGWSYTDWKEAGEKSKNFDSFKVYIIKCWNDDEEFYKIGKTYTTVKNRFKSESFLPYKYKIVEIFKGKARYISELEHQLQKKNSHNAYIPKIDFNGMHECFKELNND